MAAQGNLLLEGLCLGTGVENNMRIKLEKKSHPFFGSHSEISRFHTYLQNPKTLTDSVSH